MTLVDRCTWAMQYCVMHASLFIIGIINAILCSTAATLVLYMVSLLVLCGAEVGLAFGFGYGDEYNFVDDDIKLPIGSAMFTGIVLLIDLTALANWSIDTNAQIDYSLRLSQ